MGKFGVGMFKGLNYDPSELKELCIRLNEVYNRLIKRFEKRFRSQVAALVDYGFTLPDARTTVALRYWLEDSHSRSIYGVFYWNCALAKKVHKDLRVWFAENHKIFSKHKNVYLQSLLHYIPAYQYKKDAPVLRDINKDDREARIQKEINSTYLRNFRHNKTSLLERLQLNISRWNFEDIRKMPDPVRFLRLIIEEIGYNLGEKYEEKAKAMFSSLSDTDFANMNFLRGDSSRGQVRSNEKLVTNPVINLFDIARHFKTFFSYEFSNPQHNKELIEYYDLLFDSV